MIAQELSATEPAESEKPKTKREKPKAESPASSVSRDDKAPSSGGGGESFAARSNRWRERFAKGNVSPGVIGQTVSDLIQSKQYEEIIACLEQALIDGRMIQSWMHEVLALAMEAAGRPKAQIERVLLSSQDVIGGDAVSMMQLAAHLTRFERYDRALELYRQAAHLDPSRPEPFLQAFDLARRTSNAEALVWVAPEVLTYAWGRDRQSLRHEAEQAAADAIPLLTKAGKVSKALQLQDSMRKAKEVDLAVRLEWNGQGDLDLSVEEPSGSICSSVHPFTAAGGVFLHDGFGPNQVNCYDEYLCPLALTGEYKLRVRHVWGEIVGKRARLTIIRAKDTPFEETETQTVILGRSDAVVRTSLSHGRRLNADAAVPQPGPKQAGLRGTAGTAVLSQLGTNPVGVIPNVGGGGAVGYQPVITMISEGVAMNALATISGDRRYVRINAQPMFSSITDVFTFSPVR